MSIECSNVVWNRNFNGSSRKMVAVKLADHADDEGRGIWPAVEKIAAKCDLSCRTVQRVLSDFVKEGILRVVSEGGGGPGDTRRYDFDMAVVRSLPLAMAPPDSRDVKHENKGDTLSPLAETKGDTDDAKGDIDDNKGDTVSPKPSRTIIEPSLERVRASDAGEGEDDGSVGEAAFLRTMKKWPTGFDDSRSEALKAWNRLTTEKRLRAIRRMPDYIARKKSAGRTKFCAFSKYLSEERFEAIPDRSIAPAKATAPAYGPAWSVICIETLLKGRVPLGGPDVTRETRTSAYRTMVRMRGEDAAQAFYRRLGCDFAADGTMLFPPDFEAHQLREHRLKNGYPKVNALYDGAGLIGPDAERGQSLAGHMEFVVTDTPLMAAWQAFYEQRTWPFPKAERMRGLYFPAGGPDQFQSFERVIRDDTAA